MFWLGLQVLCGSALVACGDPMLPSDYAGPPATTVSGNVLGALPSARNAKDPAFSLEWWTSTPGQAGTLLGQPLQFERSLRDHEWNIGVEMPAARARIDFATDHVRFGIGKMIYFDDVTLDGRLDWRCVGAGCDVVKAVSAEFIVFVERPPTCQPIGGGPLRERVAPGFHYYRFDASGLRELGPGEPLSFLPTNSPLADSNPTDDLRTFAAFLIALWTRNPFEGC